MTQQEINSMCEALRKEGWTWSQISFCVALVRNQVAAERERWAVPVQALLTAHDAGLARVGEQMRAHGLTTLRLPYEVKAELDAIAVLRALTPDL